MEKIFFLYYKHKCFKTSLETRYSFPFQYGKINAFVTLLNLLGFEDDKLEKKIMFLQRI